MLSRSGRYVIAYNGEIYNARELKAELEKDSSVSQDWKGHSDTEVLLALIESRGWIQPFPDASGCSLLLCGTRSKRLFIWFGIGWGSSRFIMGGSAVLFFSVRNSRLSKSILALTVKSIVACWLYISGTIIPAIRSTRTSANFSRDPFDSMLGTFAPVRTYWDAGYHWFLYEQSFCRIL